MQDEDMLLDLLLRWEKSAQLGHPLSVEVLCADRPDLADALQTKIEAVQRVNDFFTLPESHTNETLTEEKRSWKKGSVPVGEYELSEDAPFAEGGAGKVWHAVAPGGVEVVLKQIHTAKPLGKLEVRGVKLMSKILHPHLLPMHGIWQTSEYELVVAMEKANQSLEARRSQCSGGAIPRDELWRYMRHAAEGLDYLHEQNVHHRDVKPDNLLLVGGEVKVADFGLAKVANATQTTNTGAMTPSYAAPEYVQHQTSHLHSDQYSLAVTYCVLRLGKHPFAGGKATPILAALPSQERTAVERALHVEPDQRWPSCVAFVEALTETSAPRTTTVPNRSTTVPGRGRSGARRIVLGLILLASVLTALSYFAWPLMFATEPVEIRALEVEHYRGSVSLGRIGVESRQVATTDKARIQVSVSERASWKLLVLYPNGTVETYPDAGPGNEASETRWQYPSGRKAFAFKDGGAGNAAFVVVVSRGALPSLDVAGIRQQWKPEIRLDPPSCWKFERATLEPAASNRSIGQVGVTGTDSFVDVCERLKNTPGVEDVSGLLFPVAQP